MKAPLSKLSLGFSILALCPAAFATDAQSVAMGGTGVTIGTGVNGAFTNPALLMGQKRAMDSFHFRFSTGIEIQDNNEVNETGDDANTIGEDLFDEIDNFNARDNISNCDETEQTISPCVLNTGSLGSLSLQLSEQLLKLNDSPINARGLTQIGFSLPDVIVPFAVNLSARATISLNADYKTQDNKILTDIGGVLETDDRLTADEIADNDYISFDTDTQKFTIDVSEDTLTSSIQGGAIMRAEIGISLAHSLEINNHQIDFGITPKLSRVEAADIDQKISQPDDEPSIQDQFDDRVKKSSFNFDLGAFYLYPEVAGLAFGGVIRNVVSESIKTENGYEFETTPQLIGSVLYDQEVYKLTADLALNSAKTDNLESHRIAFGAETSWKFLSLRGGLSHDLAWDNNATSFSLGFGVGVVDFGMKYNGASSAEFALQTAFGF